MTEAHNTLSNSAKIVQEALAQKGLSCQVVELSASTRTANEAAATIGCEVAQIIKSLLFRTTETNKPILVLASGSNRVNEQVIAKVLGNNITKADAEFTREVTGFAIGGVPPIGHKQPIDTLIDEDLLKFDVLWAAAGTPHAIFSLQAKDLASVTGGKIIPIK